MALTEPAQTTGAQTRPLLALRAREDLDTLLPYSSARSSGTPVTVRASSNEAPNGIAPAVRDAIVARLETINRYPQLGLGDLAATIADHLDADPGEIVVADGSLSVLNYLLLTYCRPGSTVVMAWRSYEAYPICTRTAGAEPVMVPNRPDGSHDLEAMAAAVDGRTAAVLLCTPNNPTGTTISHSDLARFVDTVGPEVLIVVDEAYLDFVDPDPDLVPGPVPGPVPGSEPSPGSARGEVSPAGTVRTRELMATHPNVVSLRTFSKAWGLAGVRVGYLIADPAIGVALRKILPPFSTNALAEAAVPAALTDPGWRDRIVATVREQRAAVHALLEERGLPHTDSQANFVWLPLGRRSAELSERCAEQGMSTRVFDDEGIRISLGEPGLLPALTAALELFPGDDR